MRAPLSTLGKILLFHRVLQWIFALIVIGTASAGIKGKGFNKELRPFYAALAFASLIVLFHSVWIPLAFLSSRRPFFPLLALCLDIILFVSLLVIAITATQSDFVDYCGDSGVSLPGCGKLVTATVFLFLLSLLHLLSLLASYLQYKREGTYGKDVDLEHGHTGMTTSAAPYTATTGGPTASYGGTATGPTLAANGPATAGTAGNVPTATGRY